ncbi:MAG: transglutaminase-like cysteine peptidase [Desulfovibrio sp.]|nr:transglutaminase-like cysteine peptidase [Desulfovibrio sp.]
MTFQPCPAAGVSYGGRRHFIAALLVLCLVFVFAAPAHAAEEAPPANPPQNAQADSAAPDGKKVQLFGTVEFKRPLQSLPQWLSVIKKNGESPVFVKGKPFKKNVSWDNLKSGAAGKKGIDLLRFVNTFWNTWPYREDILNWKVEDYWAIPAEFLARSGDCEDYSIAKYFTLKELGVSPEKMRIVVLRDTVRNLAHAVLAVYMDGDAYILDNLSNAVLSHKRLRQYTPQYSVNESGRWAHIKARPKK